VIQLDVISGKSAGRSLVRQRLPVVVGRDTGVDLQLDEPGIWGRHLEVALGPDGTFVARPQSPGIAWVNGEPAAETRLRNGDLIELGPAKLRFSLSATRQVSFRAREFFTWTAVGLLCLAQVLVIYLLMP
jgi:predicted component of type VI protein secretion system